MTGLRTIWGVSLATVTDNFGRNYAIYLKSESEKYIQQELLYFEDEILKTTKKGKFLVDGIASDLFMLN